MSARFVKKKGAAAPKKTKKAAGKAVTRKAVKKVAKKVAKKKPGAPKPAKKGAKRAAGPPKAAKGAVRAKGKTAKRTARSTAARGASKKKKSGWTPRQLEALREQLLRKRQELLQSYQSAKGNSRDRQSDGTEDYIDYAVSSYDREFLLSLSELEQTQLVLVEEALERLRRGTFGRCLQCDRPIAGKRLEVQPWARFCLRCQELDEQGLLSHGGSFESEFEDPESVDADLVADADDEVDFEEEIEPDEEQEDEVEEEQLLG